MNKSTKKLWGLLISLTALLIAGGTVSCDTGNGDDDSASDYPTATAAVDYDTDDPGFIYGKTVFIDFSSDTPIRSLPHDFFDLALFSTGSGQSSTVHIIANSGSYGAGVTALKTESTDITDDFSSQSANITHYTFKTGKNLFGKQPVTNPLDGASGSAATKNVFLVKVLYGPDDAGARYFKVVFDSYGPQGRYKITVVPGLGSGEAGKKELTGSLSGIDGDDSYGFIFFDLHGEGGPRALNDGAALKEGVTVAIPKAAEWDLLCTRTDDLTDSNRKTNRSSILLNPVRGTQAATLSGKYIDEVLTASGLEFSPEIDAIGYGWYQTDNRGTYWVDPVTYVVKTAEGHYAKFQPATFKGPSDESFHMDFRYYYAASGVFDR
jgi:hypothetical protein